MRALDGTTWRTQCAAYAVSLGLIIGCGDSTAPPNNPPPPPPPPGNSVPPTVQAQLTINGAPVLRVPGDTVRIIVTATDDIALAWFGWRASAPLGGADSVPTRGTHSAAAILEIPIPASAVGTSEITVWARDCSDVVGRCDPAEVGNRTELSLGTLEVVPLTPHTVHNLPLGGWTWETAYDATRRLMYFSIRDSSRIDILSLDGLGWQPSIPTPAPPSGLDLTPGDDQLVVGLRGTPTLGVVDLADPSHPVTTIPLTFDTAYGASPWSLKVTADRRVFVSIGTYLASVTAPLIEYDLLSGVQRTRDELGRFGKVWDRTRIFRAHDRSRLVVAQLDVCCPATANVYDAATDAFAPAQPIAYDYLTEVAVDVTGSAYLAGNVLFDRDLAPVAVADPDAFLQEFGWNAGQTLSPDGSTFYMATRYGYVAVSSQTGAVLERVALPAPPSHLFVTPDGARLVARTDRTPADTPRVFVVELK